MNTLFTVRRKLQCLFIASLFALPLSRLHAQVFTLQNILDTISTQSPSMKMYDAEIQSMDAAADGAKSWMPPEFGAGFFMTPYNIKMWSKDDMGNPGMGQFMLSGQQMFPNQKQKAEYNFMSAMSSAEKFRKQATLNELLAEAKKNYYTRIILLKKKTVLAENEKLLTFMITDAEVRYKNNLGKLDVYYKVKAEQGNLQNMQITLDNEIRLKQIILNVLMNRKHSDSLVLDTAYTLKDYNNAVFDASYFDNRRSDIRALDEDIKTNKLKQESERAKLKPEFGIKYDHMFAWGGSPWQFSLMGMMRLPLVPWASKMSKANIKSIDYKNQALAEQKNMMYNQMAGMSYGIRNEINAKRKQIAMYETSIIPSLKKNYQVTQTAYSQNTAELFMLYDAWQSLNTIQLDYLEQLQQLLVLQTELEKVLEIRI